MTGIAALFYGSGSGGGGGYLDYHVVTTGLDGTIPDRLRGFITGTMGSISPTTSAIYSAAVNGMYHDESAGVVQLAIAGLHANSGWTTITIGSTAFARADATYFQSGGDTYWEWAHSNVFGAAGATKSVIWE